MLTQEENDLLTRVGPGTPMGDLMREYWLPAFMSSELPEPDSPPLRIRLLGESLLAIRTTPTGLLRLRFAYARTTAAEATQPVVRAAGAALAALTMPTVTGFILAWAAAEVAVAVALWIAAARLEPIHRRLLLQKEATTESIN